MSCEKYLEILNRLSTVRALVVGDTMLDVYHFGRVDRISPEAPVPIFIDNLKNIEVRRGGADNVAHQIEALGCGVETHFANVPSVKHRYMVGHHQVFRIDDDSTEISRPCEERVADYDVIVISDYNKGFVTDTLCQQIIEQAVQNKKPVIVDPKGDNWWKYEGATVICPNEKEWKESSYCHPTGSHILLKRGDKGLEIELDRSKQVVKLPARAKHVYDVTGAGDTIVGVVASCMGSGANLEDSAYIANIAAGYVVGEVGTKVCSFGKLSELVCE